MLIVLKKNNIVLVSLIFLLLVTIFSLNYQKDDDATLANNSARLKTVILDAGHGGEDPGAVSNYSGLKEKDVNLNIALKIRELLEEEKIKVIMTREEDKLEYEPGTSRVFNKRKQDLQKRKQIMDNSGADIVVSIHLNKFDQSQYSGAQAFYPPNSPESKKLAECIQESIKSSADPQNNRSAHIENEPFVILRNLKTPTVIVECGFLSNREEEKKLASEEYQHRMAEAIKSGVLDYFKQQ